MWTWLAGLGRSPAGPCPVDLVDPALPHSAWRAEAVVSALNELIVGHDAALLVEDEDLQADACHFTAAGRDHFPVEFDDIAEAVGVVPKLERESPRRGEFLRARGYPDPEGLSPR